jgi:hypothetical protein
MGEYRDPPVKQAILVMQDGQGHFGSVQVVARIHFRCSIPSMQSKDDNTSGIARIRMCS